MVVEPLDRIKKKKKPSTESMKNISKWECVFFLFNFFLCLGNTFRLRILITLNIFFCFFLLFDFVVLYSFIFFFSFTSSSSCLFRYCYFKLSRVLTLTMFYLNCAVSRVKSPLRFSINAVATVCFRDQHIILFYENLFIFFLFLPCTRRFSVSFRT